MPIHFHSPRNRISRHPSHIAPKSQYYCSGILVLLLFVFSTTDILFQYYFFFSPTIDSTESRRNAFSRLNKPPGLRKRQFYSAILLGETRHATSPQPEAHDVAVLRRYSSRHGQKEIDLEKTPRAPTQNKREAPWMEASP